MCAPMAANFHVIGLNGGHEYFFFLKKIQSQGRGTLKSRVRPGSQGPFDWSHQKPTPVSSSAIEALL